MILLLRECMRGCQNVLALAFCRHLLLLVLEPDPCYDQSENLFIFQ